MGCFYLAIPTGVGCYLSISETTGFTALSTFLFLIVCAHCSLFLLHPMKPGVVSPTVLFLASCWSWLVVVLTSSLFQPKGCFVLFLCTDSLTDVDRLFASNTSRRGLALCFSFVLWNVTFVCLIHQQFNTCVTWQLISELVRYPKPKTGFVAGTGNFLGRT